MAGADVQRPREQEPGRGQSGGRGEWRQVHGGGGVGKPGQAAGVYSGASWEASDRCLYKLPRHSGENGQ